MKGFNDWIAQCVHFCLVFMGVLVLALAVVVGVVMDEDVLERYESHSGPPARELVDAGVMLLLAGSILHLLRESVRRQEENENNTRLISYRTQDILAKMTEEKAEPKD